MSTRQACRYDQRPSENSRVDTGRSQEEDSDEFDTALYPIHRCILIPFVAFESGEWV
ncbi:hypothetical protein GCM10027071_27450 [Microbacterium marinum]